MNFFETEHERSLANGGRHLGARAIIRGVQQWIDSPAAPKPVSA